MNAGTRRRGFVAVGLGATTTAGLVTLAGATGLSALAVVVLREAVGLGGTFLVVLGDGRLVAIEVMPTVGTCKVVGVDVDVDADVDVGAEADAGSDAVWSWVGVRLATDDRPAPAQPATINERPAAPTRVRAAYLRTCLISTHASEHHNVERSTFDMMAR